MNVKRIELTTALKIISPKRKRVYAIRIDNIFLVICG